MIVSRNIRTVLFLSQRRIIPKIDTFLASRPLSNLAKKPHDSIHPSRTTRILFAVPSSHLRRRFFADYPTHTVVKLPNLSPTMTTGSVVSWAKAEGDQIEEGDLLAEIETDKATMSLDASDPGYMAKIISPEGTRDIPVGTALCVVVEEAGDVAAFQDFVAPSDAAAPAAAAPPPPSTAAPPAPASVPSPPPPPPPASSPPPSAPSSRVFASPLAKSIAAGQNVDLAAIGSGSGPDGQIRAQDVQAFIEKGGAAPAAPAAAMPIPGAEEFVDIPLSNMRSVIAKRLTSSKQSIPHYYLTIDVNMGTAVALRAKMNERLKSKKIEKKLSMNDFIIKAAAIALMKVPEVNSSWHDTFIRQYNQADISVAVATEGGLITPIVAKAERLGLLDISNRVGELAGRAREGKLQPHEFLGGSFTISNLGMFGVKHFTAIINPPQAAILAVGGLEQRLVPDDASGTAVASFMSVTLCCDHRVIDGAVGAQWLQHFKQHLEDPLTMLL